MFLGAAVISLGLMSCAKSEVKVEKVENHGTIITEKEHTTTVDDAKEKLDEAGKKIDEFATDGRTQLKKAGEDVKDAAAKGAEKVEKGAEKIKEDLKKK